MKPAGSPSVSEPVALADFGSFYAGGKPVRVAGLPQRDIAFTQTASLAYDPNGLYPVSYTHLTLPTKA